MLSQYTEMMIFIQLSFYATSLTFLSQRNHLLMSLLSLEGMMLSLVIFLPAMMAMNNMFIPYISIILLTFGACEASLGLSLMVNMSRAYGSDMMKNMTMNKC